MSNPRWTDDEMRETLDASAEKSRQITRLTAENEKLRAALREIAEENIGNTAAISVYIARATLEQKQ